MSYSSSTSIVIATPLSSVWDALTKPELVKQYFFNTDMDTDWKIGSPIFFRGEWQGKPYEDKGTVLSIKPMKSLSYNYWSGFSGLPDKPELYQVISFELSEAPGGVKLTVSQSNVETQEKADHGASNWKMVLEGLKKFLEK